MADINSAARQFYIGQNESLCRPAALFNGNAYFVEVESSSVPTGQFMEVYVSTGSKAVYVEFIRTRMDAADYTFSIYEGATVTASNDVTPANLNRVSPKVAGFTAGEATTVSVQGTKLFDIVHVENNNGSEPEAAEANFMLLKPNTTYLMRYTKGSQGGANALFVLDYILVEEE